MSKKQIDDNIVFQLEPLLSSTHQVDNTSENLSSRKPTEHVTWQVDLCHVRINI